MKPERLRKFSREESIRFLIRQAKRIEYYENKCRNQEKVGQAYFEHKRYNIIFEREE